MRELRVVGAEGSSDDNPGPSTLVVADEDGERFALVVDQQLIDACTAAGAPPTPATPSITLSPRDIQTRIRTGETPEDLVAETGMPMERIMRFGYAVLQERSRVGDEARRARARRDGDGVLVPFGETVDRRFTAHGIDPADVVWDAYRRADGSWTISAAWNSGASSRQAHWSFALAARTVLAVDDVAADLLSDRPLRAVVRAVPDTPPAPRTEQVFDQESPAGYSQSAAGRGDDGYGTPPLPLRLAEPIRSATPAPTAADAGESPRQNEAESDDDAPSAGIRLLSPPTLDDALDPAVDGEPGDRGDVEPPAPQAPPVEPTPPNGKRRSGRDPIPSWDEILLGVRRKND